MDPQPHPLLGVIQSCYFLQHLGQEGCGLLDEQRKHHQGPLGVVGGQFMGLTYHTTRNVVPCIGNVVGQAVQVDLGVNTPCKVYVTAKQLLNK